MALLVSSVTQSVGLSSDSVVFTILAPFTRLKRGVVVIPLPWPNSMPPKPFPETSIIPLKSYIWTVY